MPLRPARFVLRAPRSSYPATISTFRPFRCVDRVFSSVSFSPNPVVAAAAAATRSATASRLLRSAAHQAAIRSSSTWTAPLSTSEKPVDDDIQLLPLCCPGCGAYSQTIEAGAPGYYGRQLLKALRAQSNKAAASAPSARENHNNGGGLEPAPPEQGPPEPNHDILLDVSAPTTAEQAFVPFCDRCHRLQHHNEGVAAPMPSIHSIAAFLEESPHRYNRIYHLIDAADFPMSLEPDIYEALDLADQRSKNRRSKTDKYRFGKKLATISFVITRSDLLAPKKEQVDSKMQYVRSVLRETLAKRRSERDFRLGNVHMVSSHRGWWTPSVKAEIRQHGGGIWIVGKANVGKSSFIQSCFPKDGKALQVADSLALQRHRRQEDQRDEKDVQEDYDTSLNRTGLGSQTQPQLPDEETLLPPAPPESTYPVLPLVSSLPGTTVSPIRIPFGRGKGEMIDMPGLWRGNLAEFASDEYKRDLVMKSRIKAVRQTIKPGQSLLLGGGLVRITPVAAGASSSGDSNDSNNNNSYYISDAIVMATCFVPLDTHITKTDKAIEIQAQRRPPPSSGNTALKMGAGVGKTIASAGRFELKWDVTASHLPKSVLQKSLQRTTRKGSSSSSTADARIVAHPLLSQVPYRVMSADILIEGCGWIELTAQIRRAKQTDYSSSSSSASSTHTAFPQVEVFTPNGQHIGYRKPIECWKFAQKPVSSLAKQKIRGRQNIGRRKRELAASK